MNIIPSTAVPGVEWPAIPDINGSCAAALLMQFEQSQWWTPDELLQQQMRQLRTLLQYSIENVPYYRNLLGSYQSMTRKAVTLEQFQQLPTLSRRALQNNRDYLRSLTLPQSHGQARWALTSGSTGQPVEFLATGITSLFFQALGLRFHFWHKRRLSEKNLSIRPIRKTDNLVNGVAQARWGAFYGGPSGTIDVSKPVSQVFDLLIREDPSYVQTYPHTLMQLAKRSLETGVKPGRLREARTYGEVLTGEVRDACHEAWGIQVANNYSALESGIIALECPEHRCLHVQSESVLVEVVKDDGTACGPGEVGRVLVTVLHNFGTPLIRYEVGDYAEVGEPCACGRGLPVLKRIIGRHTGQLLLPSGEQMMPDVRGRAFQEIAPVLQFQLTQKTLEDIDVRLVVASPLTENEESGLRRMLSEKLCHDFNFSFEYVDDIPRAASGKFHVFHSEVLAARRDNG